MSERYGNCRRCKGKGEVQILVGRDGLTNEKVYMPDECPQCEGSGHSGDALNYMEKELAREPEFR